MLRQLIIMILGAMLIVVACNKNDETNASNSEEISKDQVQEDEDQSLEEDEEESKEPNHSINDIEELFLHMKAAAQSITSVTITGRAQAENKIAGTTTESTMEMKIDATLDPFVQHAIYTVTDGEGGTTEWYATDDEMLLNMDDSGWQKVTHPVSVTAANLIHRDDYFDHFILYKDLFELTEDHEHYIITYIGSDEQYKEVFYGGIEGQNLGEMMKELSGLIENTEMSGAIEMKVSKDTYLIVEQHSVYHSNSENFGISMEVEQDGTYVYTYNEISSVEIPKEVIQNAKE